ncbi:MAG: glycoside hydrolase family 5 protein [Myxococcota bacterium]
MLVAPLLACTDGRDDVAGEPPASPAGWLDEAGRVRLTRGMNLAGDAKWQDDLRVELDDATLELLPAHGVDLVRYLVFWQGIEPEAGQLDVAYMDGVAEDVERLRALGVDVVIDLHQDVWGEGFGYTGFPRWACDEATYAAFTPAGEHWSLDYLDPAVVACFDAFWASEDLQARYADAAAALAERVAGRVVAYDTMNEPFWGSWEQEAFETGPLAAFDARVAEALRDVDPDAWIVVEPSGQTNLLGTSHLVLPEVDRVVYAPHFYPSYAEMGTGYDGDFADEAAWIDGLFRDDAPLWLGEFGIFSDVGNEGEWVRAVLAAVEARGGSTAYWSFDPGNVLEADGTAGWLLPTWATPRPSAVPGNVVSLETAADGFTLTYDATVDAPLRVVLPPAGCATVHVVGEPALDGEGELPATGGVELAGEPGVRQAVTARCVETG